MEIFIKKCNENVTCAKYKRVCFIFITKLIYGKTKPGDSVS